MNTSCFFFNDTATTEIYTLSLHDALPIWQRGMHDVVLPRCLYRVKPTPDRKSTRLNSSHRTISYAVFCLKKKKKLNEMITWCKYILDKIDNKYGHHK